MGTVEVNGVSLHVEEHGSGVPILGIHGTGSSSLMWADAVPALAGRGRVILYDRRGCGRSQRPRPFVTSVLEQTDDAAALLAALGAAPAVVIGRSYGGEVAVALALRHPDAVRGLALLEPSLPMLAPATREWLDELRLRVPVGAAPPVAAEELITAALGAATWAAWPPEVRRIFEDNGDAIVAELHGAWSQPTASALGTLAMPILLLSAEESPHAFRAADDALAAMIPGVRREIVGGGHVISPDGPSVLAFLDEILAI